MLAELELLLYNKERMRISAQILKLYLTNFLSERIEFKNVNYLISITLYSNRKKVVPNTSSHMLGPTVTCTTSPTNRTSSWVQGGKADTSTGRNVGGKSQMYIGGTKIIASRDIVLQMGSK